MNQNNPVIFNCMFSFLCVWRVSSVGLNIAQLWLDILIYILIALQYAVQILFQQVLNALLLLFCYLFEVCFAQNEKLVIVSCSPLCPN